MTVVRLAMESNVENEIPRDLYFSFFYLVYFSLQLQWILEQMLLRQELVQFDRPRWPLLRLYGESRRTEL